MPVTAVKPAASRDTAGLFHSHSSRRLLSGLLLVIATLAVYNPVTHNGFVNFDDDRYVTDNLHLRSGLRWTTVSWAFSSIDQANWHPLTWLSHALDYQIFHLNPVGHHYSSVLLHAVNALLLFSILQWFTGYTARSAMVAALFALHPLNVESVAWVAERKNVLAMFFFLLAVAGYGWYVRRPGIKRYLLVAILFALGLMSKPMVITLPLVLLLLDYWPFKRMAVPATTGAESRSANPAYVPENGIHYYDVHFALEQQPLRKLFLEKIPLLALSVGSAIITMVAQKAGGAVLTSAAGAPLLRLQNSAVCYVLYIKKALWPSHLAVLYPYPHSLPAWQVTASVVFLVLVTSTVLKYRRHRYLVVGWFWYLGTMIPMSGLVQVGNQAMADRYAYLPLVGLFLMAVWSAAEWANARHLSTSYQTAAGLAVLLAFSAVTHAQIRYWHDDLSLWSHALAVTHENYVAENNLATALIKENKYDDAVLHFRTASAIEPGDPVSQLNLGIYAQEHGDLRQAAARYDLALHLATDPQLRASAYADLGTVYFALRDYAKAQQNFDSALKLNGVFPIALFDMGLIAQKSAENAGPGTDLWNRAADYFAQLVAIDPSDVGYLVLSNALHQAGRHDEANLAYQQALRLSRNIGQTRQRVAQLAGQ